MAWTEPKSWTPGELVTAAMMNTYVRDNLNALFPVGAYLLRASNYTTVETAVEARWLQCNGVAVSRTTYSELFNLLNALSPTLPFGAGNGTTTFNLPDLRGRTPYAEGEHAYVDVMGDNEGQAIGQRGPAHYHQWYPGQGESIGGTYPNAASYDDTPDTRNTSPYPTGAQDVPAFLVAGSWFIKYH